MVELLPSPPVPADVDLRDFAFTPMFRARLFGSSFHARSSDSEWRAGVTLWLRSWDQVPAGSLPDDDVELCRLAELARNLRTWRRVKAQALHGWFKCNDSRLYHWVVAEGVLEAHQRRCAASAKGKLGASKRWSYVPDASATNSNGTSNVIAIAGAMPGDSNRQGRDREEPPKPPLQGGLPELPRREKNPDRARRDASRAAWAQSELARKANDFEGLKRSDPVAAEAVRLMGGFTAIGLTNTDRIPQLRVRFRETYEALLDRREHHV